MTLEPATREADPIVTDGAFTEIECRDIYFELRIISFLAAVCGVCRALVAFVEVILMKDGREFCFPFFELPHGWWYLVY